MTERVAYKVMTAAEYAQMQREHVFHGSAADLADGFIHMSTAAQLAVTVDKHFHGQTGLVVLAVDLSRLGAALRWEPSRGGDLFPHCYGPLPMTAVTATGPLDPQPDGAAAT